MCTSVPQMAVLSTRITTSPAPALGTGTLSSARPGPRWFLTSASMDSTASPSVRRLSCGERPRQLIEACPLAFHLGAQFVQARRHRTEASLPAQVVVERGLVRAGVDAVTLAVEHLVQREEAAGHCEADELDALGGLEVAARRERRARPPRSGLRPLPAVRGVRRRALPHQRPPRRDPARRLPVPAGTLPFCGAEPGRTARPGGTRVGTPR